MHRLITTLLNEKNERKSDKDTKLDVLNILANVAALPNAGGEVSRVMSCRVVSCRVVSCRVVSCRVVSCRVVSCRVVSCRVTSHQ